MKRTLVVGGRASYVNDTGRRKLARWGFSVDWHVEVGKKQERNPSADPKCEAVVIFEEMVSDRSVIAPWRKYSESRGLMFVVLDRHESHWPAQFEHQGFKTIHPVTAAAVADVEDFMTGGEENQRGSVVSLPVSGGTPARVDSFSGRKVALVELLRDMRDRDGLTEILWSPESGLSLKRTVMRPVTEETSEQL